MDRTSKAIVKLPHTPGIYQFLARDGTTIYVGKAKDLKNRVTSYFQKNRLLGPRTTVMVSRIDSIKATRTASEFDAMLLEAKLIRQLQPQYNVISKDDKSPLYVVITLGEQLPRILYVRKQALSSAGVAAKTKNIFFGPFQSSRVARSILRELRPIVPFCTQKTRNGKACFYTHLGLCNPCPSEIITIPDIHKKIKLIRLYRSNVRMLTRILSGKSLSLKYSWLRQMKRHSALSQFELAAQYRDRIQKLLYILDKHYDPMLYLSGDTGIEIVFEKEREELIRVLRRSYPSLQSLKRIECIDISNTIGKHATGSLVVLINSQPDPSLYRRFRIKTTNTPNDTKMIAEVLTRRLSHTEWPYPDLLVIDGGKGQLTSALEVLRIHKLNLPVIGLAKREEQIVVPKGNTFQIISLDYTSPALLLLKRMRDEAHRFALTYHRLLRRKNQTYLPE